MCLKNLAASQIKKIYVQQANTVLMLFCNEKQIHMSVNVIVVILNQHCPRVFFRSPQMWQMNVTIRPFLRIELK